MDIGETYISIEKHTDDFGRIVPPNTKFTVVEEVFGMFTLMSNDGFLVIGTPEQFNWLKKEDKDDNNN